MVFGLFVQTGLTPRPFLSYCKCRESEEDGEEGGLTVGEERTPGVVGGRLVPPSSKFPYRDTSSRENPT